jgi:N-acetylglucosamine kinase-like BadF-type ATPase
MKYLIGFDCGATKTKCAIADVDGNIIHSANGKPSNYLVIGIDNAVGNILSLLDKFKSELDFTQAEIEKVVIGAAGAGRKEDAEKLRKAVTESASIKGIIFKSITVVSDAQIALEGAFPQKPGCIIIAGTGSIIYGKDKEGNVFRDGGFGRLIGDEGSGYSIGRKALRAAAGFFDGRGEKTLIVKLIAEKFFIKTSDDLISKVYKEDLDIASVAQIVLTAAKEGDKIALNILAEESDQLIELIKAMMNKMNTEQLNVSPAGSLISNKNDYSDMLLKKIKTYLPSVKVIKPEHSPVEGAIILAKELLND